MEHKSCTQPRILRYSDLRKMKEGDNIMNGVSWDNSGLPSSYEKAVEMVIEKHLHDKTIIRDKKGKFSFPVFGDGNGFILNQNNEFPLFMKPQLDGFRENSFGDLSNTELKLLRKTKFQESHSGLFNVCFSIFPFHRNERR